MLNKLKRLMPVRTLKRLTATLLAAVMLFGMLGNIPFSAFAAEDGLDLTGSHVVDREDGSFTLVVKGAIPISMETGAVIQLRIGMYDFLGQDFTTAAPVRVWQWGMGRCGFEATSDFTIPTTGLQITVRNFMNYSPVETAALDILNSYGIAVANETIPVYLGQGPGEGDEQISLALSVPATSFSPDWEGNLSAPVTVTVTAKDAFNATDTSVNGRAVLYTENGPVTLMNDKSYVYVDMANGTGTAQITKLVDMGGIKDPYTVDLKASLPLYGAASDAVTLNVTPNPLSVTGKVIDENGNNIVGATVCLMTADGYMASRGQTDHAGNYLLYGSPKSSSYRVIATYNDLYGEVTKNLLPQPANNVVITLYSHIKVEVNFYRNKATLDGVPNTNVVSPANLYAAGTYTVEAYTDANGNNPIAPNKTDGRSVFFTMADLLSLGGKLYIKAVPYSKYQEPFIDSSSELVEVDYSNAPDMYNITLDLEERPVGTVTVKNTGTKPLYVCFSSGTTNEKYTEHNTIIQPGGQYTFAPKEGYNTVTGTVAVWFNGSGFAKNYDERYSERYLATVGVRRKDELSINAEDVIRPFGALLTMEKQFGDVITISFRHDFAQYIQDKQYTIELPQSLELPANWKNYVSLSICGMSEVLSAEQINAVYDSVRHTIKFSYDFPYAPIADGNFRSTEYMNSYLASCRNKIAQHCYTSAVYTFAVKAKDSTADMIAHRIVAYCTRIVVETTANVGGNSFEFYTTNYPVSSLSFTTGHPLTLEAPATTVSDKVFVQGYAKPNAAVTISADGYGALATLTANSAGRYSGTVTLPKLETSKDIKLVATSEGKTSNKATIRYSTRFLYTQELWMTSKTAGQFDKKYLLINNKVNYVGGAPVVVDGESGKTQNLMLGEEVKFQVKMSDNKAVQKVFVSMERADGSSLGSIPCIYNAGTGFWESAVQDGAGFGGAVSYRVTYVLNIGHEYMSPEEIEANMRASDEALANYIPPTRMFTDPEAYENELRQALLDAMPPEVRNATYTNIGGGVTQMRITTPDGKDIEAGLSSIEITGTEFDALAGKAEAKGIKFDGGEYYREINYICALTTGGTRNYTQEAFEDAIYDQWKVRPAETYEQLLGRLNIKSIRMETTQFLRLTQGGAAAQAIQPMMMAMGIAPMNEPLLGRGEAVREVMEIGTAGAGVLMSGGVGVAGTVVGGANAVASALGLPDKFSQSSNARDLANAYEAMYNNFKDLQNTVCYNALTPEFKAMYAARLNGMQTQLDNIGKLRNVSYANTGFSSLTAVGSAGATIATGGGAGAAGTGAKALIGNLFSAFGSTIGSVFDYSGRFNSLYDSFKSEYELSRSVNEAFREHTATACGEKASDKSQGNYNFIYDPQGTVYDGTLDYPVAGVRAELWTANDGNGTGARYWEEAEDYDQINPQITDIDGMFSWFTPEGWWQVRIFEWNAETGTKGAELGRSEWLKVLPPHFGVNINIGKEPVTVLYEGNGGYVPMELTPGDAEEMAFLFSLTAFPQTVFQIPQGKTHAVIANEFIREGYEFTGWNTKEDGTGTAYKSGDEITMAGDVTLYAQWEAAGGGEELPDGGLPGWAIALIVVGCVLVLGGGGFCVYWFVIRKKKKA